MSRWPSWDPDPNKHTVFVAVKQHSALSHNFFPSTLSVFSVTASARAGEICLLNRTGELWGRGRWMGLRLVNCSPLTLPVRAGHRWPVSCSTGAAVWFVCSLYVALR